MGNVWLCILKEPRTSSGMLDIRKTVLSKPSKVTQKQESFYILYNIIYVADQYRYIYMYMIIYIYILIMLKLTYGF